MNKNKGFIGLGLILAIVLGIVVVGGGAYYLGKGSLKEEVKVEENNLPNNLEINQNKNLSTDNNQAEENNSHEIPTGPYGDEANYIAPPRRCSSDTTPWIKVVSPNGGEVFKVGDKMTVKWKSCNLPVGVDVGIDLLNQTKINPLTNVDHVIIQQTKNDGSEVISLLPQKDMPSFTNGNLFKIRMSYVFTSNYIGSMPNGHFPDWANQADESDNLFTINSETKNISTTPQSSYIKYSGEAPFTFTYPSNLFKPDLYYTNNGSKGLSIMSIPDSNVDGCDMLSISTLEFNKIPVCNEEGNRYTPGVMNYCKIVVGSLTKTTYRVNASTPQVCGKPASQEARNFVDHIVGELVKQ